MFSKEFTNSFKATAHALREFSTQWDRQSIDDINKFEGAISNTNPANTNVFTYPKYLPSFDEFAGEWGEFVNSVCSRLDLGDT